MSKARSIEDAKRAHEANGWIFPEEFPFETLEGRLYASANRLVFQKEGDGEETPFTQALIAWKLGRHLKAGEGIRFVDSNKKDLRFTNLKLRSPSATARELWETNGDPVPGFSHCLCGCGEALDIETQREHPHAYFPGHSPNDKIREKAKAAALAVPGGPKVKKNLRTLGRKRKPKPVDTLARDMGLVADAGEASILTPSTPGPMSKFRPLFEAMIRELPWSDFEQILEKLMEIKSREKTP
jgi:hypothetical protein